MQRPQSISMARVRVERLLIALALFMIGAVGALAVTWIVDPVRDPAGPSAWSPEEIGILVFLGGGCGALTAFGVFAWQDRRSARQVRAT